MKKVLNEFFDFSSKKKFRREKKFEKNQLSKFRLLLFSKLNFKSDKFFPTLFVAAFVTIAVVVRVKQISLNKLLFCLLFFFHINGKYSYINI